MPQRAVRDPRRELVVVGDEHDAVAEWRETRRSRRASAARVARSCPSVGSSSMIHGIAPESGQSQLSRLRATSGNS